MFNNMIEASWLGGLDYHVIRNLEARLENLIIIQQESDFPVQDATTITGEEGFAYMIVKPFTTNKTFIGTNCVIRGISTIIQYWTYTGTGYAIENSLESRVSIYDIDIEATNGTFGTIPNGKIGYSNRGGIINLSEKPVTFLVNAEFVLDVGGTKNIGVALYVDDGITETELPASHKDYSSNQDRPVSCIASVRLDTGDEVFPKFENNSNNATYTVNNYTLIINKTA